MSHQSCSPFPSISVGALGLSTFLPQCTVRNMRISELGVLAPDDLQGAAHLHAAYGLDSEVVT